MTKEQLLNQNKINKATIANYERKIAEYALALDSRNKVLKIIKEKNVEIRPFKAEFVEQNNDYRFYLENYDYYHYDNYEILTEAEFNLLKEYFK